MDEVRIPWVFDSRGVTKGAEEIEKAFDKVEKKGKSAMGDGGSAGITDAALTKGLVKAERSLKSHHSEMEREHKAHNQRIYQEAERAAQYRYSSLLKNIRRESSAMRAAGGHGGGAGGGTRYAGDLVNILTGSSGNVMRLNALSHSGLPIGAAAGGAALAGVGVLTAMGAAVNQQFNSAGSANETARAGILGTNRSTMFSGAGQGVSALSSQIEAIQAQGEKEGEANKAIAGVIQDRDRNFATRGFFGAIQRWKTSNFRGENKMPTPEEMKSESEGRMGILTRQGTLLRGQRGEAIGHEAATAQERFGGSSLQAKRMEIDMAEKAAEIEAAKQQLTAEEWEKKKETFAIQRKENEFEERSAKVRAEYAQEMAEFRGTAEQRTRHAMDSELVQEKSLLDLAKQKGNVEEIRDAKARAAAASTARFYGNRELQSSAIGRSSAISAGAFGLASTANRAGMAYYGASEPARFQSGQSLARAGAAQSVGTAQIALTEATKQAALHKGDAEYAKQQLLAQQNLNRAKIEQFDVDRRLTAEAKERTYQLNRELAAQKNIVGAMKLTNAGRGDLAKVKTGRDQSSAAAEQAMHEGHPEMAEQIQAQQHENEIGMLGDKFLNPNGTPRNRFAVQKEERELRRTEGRRTRANNRFEASGGLKNIHRTGSPAGPGLQSGGLVSGGLVSSGLNGEIVGGRDALTNEDMFARKPTRKEAAADADKEASPTTTNTRLGTIIQILQDRLPAG